MKVNSAGHNSRYHFHSDYYDLSVLISGDSDFERSVLQLKARGKRFKICLQMDLCLASCVRSQECIISI
jgi:hypothetical protein